LLGHGRTPLLTLFSGGARETCGQAETFGCRQRHSPMRHRNIHARRTTSNDFNGLPPQARCSPGLIPGFRTAYAGPVRSIAGLCPATGKPLSSEQDKADHPCPGSCRPRRMRHTYRSGMRGERDAASARVRREQSSTPYSSSSTFTRPARAALTSTAWSRSV